jgi:hypothetical protein
MSLSGDTNLHVAILEKIIALLKRYPDGFDGETITVEGYSSEKIIEYLFEQKNNNLIEGNDTTTNRRGKSFFVKKVTLKGEDYLKQHQ